MSLPWRWARRAAEFAAACYVGLQIRIPGIRHDVLPQEIWRTNDSALLKLFDTISGHGLSRGSILALSITPFLAARFYIWLGKKIFPRFAALEETQAGRSNLKRWTRLLNLVIAVGQSFGYAQFLQRLPNVVVTPGPAFLLGTTALLATGAVVMMHLSERITAIDEDANVDADDTTQQKISRGVSQKIARGVSSNYVAPFPAASHDVPSHDVASHNELTSPQSVQTPPPQLALNAPQSIDEMMLDRVVRTTDEVRVPK